MSPTDCTSSRPTVNRRGATGLPPLPPARALAACRCCQRSIQSSKRDTTNRPSPPSSCRPTLLRQGGRLRDAARHTHMHGGNMASPRLMGIAAATRTSRRLEPADAPQQPSSTPADVALGLVERKVELALHGGRADLAPVDRDLSGSKEKSHARCLTRQPGHGGHVETGRELCDPSRAQPPQQQGSHRQDACVMWWASRCFLQPHLVFAQVDLCARLSHHLAVDPDLHGGGGMQGTSVASNSSQSQWSVPTAGRQGRWQACQEPAVPHPLTLPSKMSSSAPRRDATPADAMACSGGRAGVGREVRRAERYGAHTCHITRRPCTKAIGTHSLRACSAEHTAAERRTYLVEA